MKIGVLGDTHGYFHPEIPQVFQGVERIIHTGDMGSRAVYEKLCGIAPVILVKGNHEPELTSFALPDPSIIQLRGRKIFLTHRLLTMDWNQFKDGFSRLNALPFSGIDLVIFGHTHFPVWEQVRGIYFLNPGYAGSDLSEAKPTVALLELSPEQIQAEIIEL